MLSVLFLAACSLVSPPTPVDVGRAEVSRALHAAGLDDQASRVEFRVGPPRDGAVKESFTVRAEATKLVVEAPDPVGAMYGAMELAERVSADPKGFEKGLPVSGKPFLADRGLNVFLTLPWDYQKNTTDLDPAALVSPDRWWFQNEQYWTTLLDIMARARFNWLDLHGTWDINETSAPNLYAYFVECPSFPKVGVSAEIKAANLKQLNHVIEMAHERGIRVSLMAYEAHLTVPHNTNPPYPRDEATAYAYTREAVETMIRGTPGLDAIGFRIGESGHSGEFFNCYLEAVAKCGRDIPLITRSWVTRRSHVLPLAAKSSDFTVEIKYNGEHWGPPYPIVGGRAAGWYSYSFEDYFSDPGAGPFKKMWPGVAVEGGQAWPSEPYKVVWQVRLNGTHRIFPFYDPGWVRRSVSAMKLGSTTGYTIEPMNAYFPASPAYYQADAGDRWCDWIHQRDEFFLTTWGRLGYDPTTPDEVFDRMIEKRFGDQGKSLVEGWKAASRIVPTAFSAFTLGPDHRSHAPELEWGGDTRNFIEEEPFDSHVFMSVKEAIAVETSGGQDGRLTPVDAARTLVALQERAARASGILLQDVPEPVRKQAKEIQTAALMLRHLAMYYADRLRAADAAARADGNGPDKDDRLREAGGWMRGALAAWTDLSESPEAKYYRPFTDRLRLHTNEFHWRTQLPMVKTEADRYPAPVDQNVLAVAGPAARPSMTLPTLTWEPKGEWIECTLSGGVMDRAWLLVKPLPSATFFHKVEMKRAETSAGPVYRATVMRERAGLALAAEARINGRVYRAPSWESGPPYQIVPALPGPTPTYYSSEEALTYLKPEIITPDRYSMMLLAPRAWQTHAGFSVSQQRKLIDAVERGMTLVIMQQEYAMGRYSLDWLGPQAPKVELVTSKVFDPAGALSMPRVESPEILWQRFAPAPGWVVIGNGGVAHAKRGKGEIWMIQARLMQRMSVPAAAQAMVAVFQSRGTDKPILLVDAGTEGGDLASSVIPDFLNAHSIPFVTIGEAIAEQQGADSLAPVPGRVSDDMVLEGRGTQMMRSYLVKKAKSAAALPPPKDAAEFKQRQAHQRAQLMVSLGLDPMPERTPLNAKITGGFKRDGYRVEKLVYESRPGFPVTALVYVPDAPAGRKFPVIVNPHGHWAHKKAEPVVQTRAISQALRGYLAIVVDSPGHSFEGDAHIERRWAGSHDDLFLASTVGSTTGVYVWDLIRALDYLETRPDTDMTRVGITGTSGGGLATVYAFAADERFTCGIPVCYATSLEVNPINGCLCNHVPGTLQIGDRSDILAIRAPAPVMVIGATRDDEFPAAGMKRTGEKLAQLYRILGAEDNVAWKLVDSGHDYNQPMREAAMGFFEKHLKHAGDGSPAPEPAIKPEPINSPDMFCFVGEESGLRTMRDLAIERVALIKPQPFDAVVTINGGVDRAAPLNARIVKSEPAPTGKTYIAFDAAPGLSIPGILWTPKNRARGVIVLVSEHGKVPAEAELNVRGLTDAGFACLTIDTCGTGEIASLDERLMAYLGRSVSFERGWEAARAVEALVALQPSLGWPKLGGMGKPGAMPIGVIGAGPSGSQAATFAALLEPDTVEFVIGLGCLRSDADLFDANTPTTAIPFRSTASAPVTHLRSLVQASHLWRFAGEAPVDLPAAVINLCRPK